MICPKFAGNFFVISEGQQLNHSNRSVDFMWQVYSEKDYGIGEAGHGLGHRKRRARIFSSMRKWRPPRNFGTTKTMFFHSLLSFSLINHKASNTHPYPTYFSVPWGSALGTSLGPRKFLNRLWISCL
jgi:hypothetical protein